MPGLAGGGGIVLPVSMPSNHTSRAMAAAAPSLPSAIASSTYAPAVSLGEMQQLPTMPCMISTGVGDGNVNEHVTGRGGRFLDLNRPPLLWIGA